MAITKRTVIDQISADEHGNVSVRERTDIVEDGNVLSFTYHRHVVAPGDDLKDEHKRVQAIAKVVHTPDAIKAHKKRIEEALAAHAALVAEDAALEQAQAAS